MRSKPALPLSELARFRGGALGKVVLVAITIIPMLYAGLLVWANLDPANRLDNVTAAIVNEDEPVTLTGEDGDEQIVPLGRTLAGELTSNDEGNNWDWVLTDADDARDGLEDGTYAAVITIPKDFSANATSTSGDDGTQAQQAVLSVQTNDGANILTGNITRLISDAATRTLSGSVTQTYLENVYVGFNTIHDQISTASDGATQLADGTSQLADGAADLDSGSTELAEGLTTLSDGASSLASGNADLASGAGSLSDGNAQLAQGAGSLSTGLSTLDAQASALPDQATALADGGASAAAGADELATKLAQFQTATAGLPDQAAQLDQSTQQILGAVQDTLVPGASELSAGAADLSAGVNTYTGTVATMQTSICSTLGAAPTVDPRLTAMCQYVAALTAQNATLQAGATGVAAGASALSDGLSVTTDPQQPSLLDALTQLQQQGTAPLAANAPAISTGVADAATGAATLSAGVGQLAAGTAAIADAAPALVGGIDQATSGAATLSSGAAQAADGASALAGGADRAAAGAQSLSAGAQSARTGAQSLSEGASALSDGADTADSGAQELADGLTSGVDSIPTYTDAEIANLSEVAATPVTDDVTRINEVASYGYGLAPYFMSLAAWVGAMALYMILRALPQRAIASTAPSWRVALAGFAPGAVLSVAQAVLMVTIVRYAVGVEAADLVGLFVFAVVVGLTFTAINQALIAAFGTAGRFLGLILICLQLTSAGATYPIGTTPGFFQALHPYLPMSYSVQGFRSLIAGGGLGVGQGYVVLAVWFLIAVVVSVVAAGKQQKWTVDRLHPELVL